MCGLSTTFRSRFIRDAERIKLRFAQVIHPTAHVSRTARIGKGTVVGPGVIVAAHAVIGDHVYLNRGALVGHHSVLHDYVTVGPGANIAGCCQIAAATYIAMSAVILDGMRIGKHSVIGAGAVVTRDVPDHVQVVGIPARITQQGIPGK